MCQITKSQTQTRLFHRMELMNLFYRLFERLISRLVQLLAGWFFTRAKAEYPKQTLSCGMMVEAYAAVYGRLHGMGIMSKLSCLGDEQFDEQIVLYFDGRKEIKQLTDKEEYTETGDINEIEGITSQSVYESESENQEEINPQTVYAGEPESQDDMESDENDGKLDIDSNSMEYINKYMIPEQSFDVTLDDWGEVKFVSCKPTYNVDPREYASFFLLRDDQIAYRFPYRYREKNNTTGKSDRIGSFDSVGAVAFRDINNDGKKDIIIICYYFFGAGPTGMVPRPDNIIYLAGDNEFILAKDIMEDVKQHIPEKEMTIENICNYLNDSN